MFCESRASGSTGSPEAMISLRGLVGIWAQWEKHVSVEAAVWLSFHLCMLNQSQQLSMCVGWSVADSCYVSKRGSFSFHPSCIDVCGCSLTFWSWFLATKLTSDLLHVTSTLALLPFFFFLISTPYLCSCMTHASFLLFTKPESCSARGQ